MEMVVLMLVETEVLTVMEMYLEMVLLLLIERELLMVMET